MLRAANSSPKRSLCIPAKCAALPPDRIPYAYRAHANSSSARRFLSDSGTRIARAISSGTWTMRSMAKFCRRAHVLQAWPRFRQQRSGRIRRRSRHSGVMIPSRLGPPSDCGAAHPLNRVPLPSERLSTSPRSASDSPKDRPEEGHEPSNRHARSRNLASNRRGPSDLSNTERGPNALHHRSRALPHCSD